MDSVPWCFTHFLQSFVDKATQHPPTSPTNTVWKALPNTLHQWSSTTIIGGALVAVGGYLNQSFLHHYIPLRVSSLYQTTALK